MAKKKSTNLGLILKVVVLVLGVAAFCMAFVECVKFVAGDGAEAYTGFQAMFGYSEETVLGESKYLAFSIMALITFALPLVGAILSCLNNKICRLAGAICMIVGAVLMFLLPQFVVLATVDGKLTLAAAILDACDRTLAIGAILGGIFSALGGLVAGYTLIKK